MRKRSSVCTLFLVGLTFLRISIMMKNVQFFFLGEIGENFLLTKQSKFHPRQMQLGMRSFQALQVQASPSSCDMSLHHTAFAINSCQFQNYLFHAQDFPKGGKVTDNIQFFIESQGVRRFRLSRTTDRSIPRKISKQKTQVR